jgi:hypothetical protein
MLVSAPALLVVLVGFALTLGPDERGFGTHEKLGMQPCLTMKLWTLPCPGCGVTTSLALAARGELGASFANQPFGFLLALALAAFVLWAPIAHLRGRDLWHDLLRVRFGLWGPILVLLLVLSWLYKIALVRGWM